MIRTALLAGGFLSLAATAAHAQQDVNLFTRDRTVSVRDRPHPEYDALGVREGGFLVFPKLQSSLDYDDNIYASDTNRTSDGIFELDGSVAARSQWSRHALNGSLDVTRDQFTSNTSESTTTATAEVDGRYDIQRNTFVTARGEYAHLVEPRSAETATTDSVNPIEYNRGTLDFNGTYGLNRVQLVGNVSFLTYDYSNGKDSLGGIVDQQYRNHSELRARAEADYAISPATAVYVAATGLNFNYDDNADKQLINRDSTGFELTAGADFELSALIRGRAEIGYRDESFSYAGASDVSGLDYHVRVEYFPTQLTTVTVLADRVIGDSGILVAPAYVADDFSVQADHELLRNLLLTARAEYTHYTVHGVDRHDDRGGVTLGGSYLLNHGVGLNLNYSYFRQTSGGQLHDRDFDINQIRLGLVLQY